MTPLPAQQDSEPALVAMSDSCERLNLGCGPNAPPGWVNLDGSWNAWFARHPLVLGLLTATGLVPRNHGAVWTVKPVVHDIRRPLPFRDNEFSAIYASHVLEHLYLTDAQSLLRECRRILKPGGTLRLVVPDIESMVEDYVERRGRGEVTAADFLNERLAYRKPAAPAGNLLMRLYATLNDFHTHKWMYDSATLTRYVAAAGFQSVTLKGYLESAIPDIAEVERPERVLNGEGICIEATKGDGANAETWDSATHNRAQHHHE